MVSKLVAMFERKIQMHQEKIINSLPNEILRSVLLKLDLIELIPIRRVCKRWMVIIEDICHEKTTMVIESKCERYKIYSQLPRRFNYLVDFSNCVMLKLESIEKNNYLPALCKLFSSVENLIFNSQSNSFYTAHIIFPLLEHWSSTITTLLLPRFFFFHNSHHTPLADLINKLTALKRLDFLNVNFLKNSTLAQLEHFSFDINVNNKRDMLKIVPLLGTCCTSFNVYGYISLDVITQLPKIVPLLVKGLTHLRFATDELDILAFLCANFCALQTLSIAMPSPILNADTMAHFARLSNLTQLKMYFIKIDLSSLARSKLSLKSVKILTIVLQGYDRIDGDEFCRVLSSIFPNVQQLTVKHQFQHIRDGISQHLNHFAHLRKHLVTIPDDII